MIDRYVEHIKKLAVFLKLRKLLSAVITEKAIIDNQSKLTSIFTVYNIVICRFCLVMISFHEQIITIWRQ